MKSKPPPKKKKSSAVRRERADTPQPVRAASQSHPVAVVGVGASAGGLEAFTEFLKAMPANTGLAFVYIQHLAPSRVSMLAEILSRATPMPVSEIEDQRPVEPNHVYVVPPGRTATVRAGKLRLVMAETQRAVDQFLTSLAEERGPQSIGVILSGTATDGTLGLEAVKAAGGVTFAQNSTAQHDGMPRSAVSSGCVDFVLAPTQIAQEIVALLPHLALHHEEVEGEVPAPADEFAQVLGVLRQETGVDFTQYKSNTLHRRIRRRMALHRMPSLADYAQYLASTPKEVEALYQDILIGVTSFFRDPEAFEMLKERVFPALFKDRSRHDPVRLWVLGCATGEEAYSLAIAVKEYAISVNSQVPFIVYATDLNNLAIEKSRAGLYPKAVAADVTPERLRRFFVEADGGYRIAKSIRDVCVFARQNVLTDPPFSRMDLISCRNVLIYMESVLQRKLLPLLHYALKPAGFLFLGPSESLGGQRESFEVLDAKHKVFRKKPVATRIDMVIPPLVPATRPGKTQDRGGDLRGETRPDIQRDAERVLLSRYVPAGVLINSDFEILQFRGDTGLFLAPAPGKATLNVLKMARDGLLVPLRTVLQRAMKENTTVRQEGVRVKSNGGFKEISLTAIPVHGAQPPPCCWILFEVTPKASARGAKTAGAAAPTRKAQPHELRERDDQISHLTQELAATREYLQSVIEQQEAANEELQSANEEVQSANEELQSINEELETSKEEIQSSNEELTTVNEELQNRNEELNRLNNDLNNLFSSVQMAMVMVWRDLRIRRFTPLAEKLFNLIASDVGRPISDIKLKIDVGDLPKILTEVIDSVVLKELEVRDPDGHWYQLRLRPYKTFENQIDGAVIMLIDIDTLKKNQEAIARQAELLEHTTDAVFVHDPSGLVQYWNRGAELLYGIPRADAVGKRVQQLVPMDLGQAQVARKALEEAGQWRGELIQRRADQTVVVAANQVLFQEGGKSLVLETHHDVSEHKRLEATLQKRVKELALADESKNDFLAMLAHELRNPLAPLRNAVQILNRAPLDAGVNERTRALIDRQVTNMVRMVDDLLDAARLTKGRIELKLEPLVLQSVVQRAVEATRALADERGHAVKVLMPRSPVHLHGDGTRLEQVFSNLLNNAIKYTERNGEISLTVVESKGDIDSSRPEVVVRVRDNGIGISPDMLSRVFDLFAQADNSIARTQGGLGIGLNIVRSLVELHGGEVSAHSAGLRLGSEFVVRLPVVPSDEERAEGGKATDEEMSGSGAEGAGAMSPEEEALPPHEHHSASRFLVVDDSPDIVESTATLLGLQGYVVETATNGEEALRAAEKFRPDVMLLDLGMPGLDGFAVARRIRGRQALRGMTLVAVSGYGSEIDRLRAREAGFDFHFTKPLDLEALEALVHKH